jgi:hypothetical protein
VLTGASVRYAIPVTGFPKDQFREWRQSGFVFGGAGFRPAPTLTFASVRRTGRPPITPHRGLSRKRLTTLLPKNRSPRRRQPDVGSFPFLGRPIASGQRLVETRPEFVGRRPGIAAILKASI